jgi:hypothetical protein
MVKKPTLHRWAIYVGELLDSVEATNEKAAIAAAIHAAVEKLLRCNDVCCWPRLGPPQNSFSRSLLGGKRTLLAGVIFRRGRRGGPTVRACARQAHVRSLKRRH